MKNKLIEICKNAKKASNQVIDNKIKNKVLLKFAQLVNKNKFKILSNNKKDVFNAKKNGLKNNMIQRLELNEKKIEDIISSIKQISRMKDPVNVILKKWKRPNGLKMRRVTVPLGVVGVIYESRPNVTSDVSCLCFKSGNCVILKGGSEAYYSNKLISDLFREALKFYNVNINYVQFIKHKSRKIVQLMLSNTKDYIDVIIPRGGKGLVKTVQDYSKIPVIGHLEGVCHTYVDEHANLKMAEKIVVNAKMRNTSICGATETLLIHEKVLKKYAHSILKKLEKKNCIIYADKKIQNIYKGRTKSANLSDWSKEYLSAEIAVKSVKNLDEAINHINTYGTMHTDAIITKDKRKANLFMKKVKSSIAIHNSSTQFADGGEFGFGGEVGISTSKLPPRGPVGLAQLVTYKYEVYGSGQVRD